MTRALALAIALALAGCGKDVTPAPGSGSPGQAPPGGVVVTLGHAGPLTGSIAHQGKDDVNGVAISLGYVTG